MADLLPDDRVETAHDVCTPTLVQRIAALLDQPVAPFADGALLPRGWHVALFTISVPQSQLRPDGVGGLGFTLPDLGLPRLVMGGRRVDFRGDITIGSRVSRQSRVVSITPKQGRSGRLAIATVRHDIFEAGDDAPKIVEEQDYVMREAATAPAAPAGPTAAAMINPQAVRQVVTPDETMLFRYCAITFNAHRIHYDLPFAEAVERYPGIVVNGGLSALLLIELFKQVANRNPDTVEIRNLGLLYCGRPMSLGAVALGDGWGLTAADDRGHVAVEATAR